MTKFPTLYSRSSTGSVLVWNIEVSQNEIITSWGIEDGAVQVTRDLVTEGKNIGKKNETTPDKQALSEAESKWSKKQDREGYVEDKSQIDTDLREGFEPMLAHRYDKYPDKMEFPCFIQPKLDGHRCLAVIKNGKCNLYSRTRTLITGVPHINKILSDNLKYQTLILDGELYNHDYKDKFEDLTGFIRSTDPKEGYEVVQFHVYDVISSGTFQDRNIYLDLIFDELGFQNNIKKVYTVNTSQNEVTDRFKQFRLNGYEGAMLRGVDTKYEQKRSYGLLKVKEFDDAEFQIVGVNEGRGKLKGHAIFECVTEDGETKFEAKLKGSEENLKTIFSNPEPFIGRRLTVQFQGRTKNNIPRFPVGLRVRTDI